MRNRVRGGWSFLEGPIVRGSTVDEGPLSGMGAGRRGAKEISWEAVDGQAEAEEEAPWKS